MVQSMLGKLFSGLLLDLVEKLSGGQGDEWYEELGKFLRKESTWTTRSVLKQIDTFECPAIGEFIPAEQIKVGVSGIGWISPDVHKVIADLSIEPERSPMATLNVHELDQPAKLRLIADEIGADRFVTAGQAMAVITSQSKGERGVLRVDGWWNIVPIRGTVWALCCDWDRDDRSWFLYAYPLSDVCAWDVGYRVLSL